DGLAALRPGLDDRAVRSEPRRARSKNARRGSAAVNRAQSNWDRFWFAPSPAWPLGLCRALFFGMLAIWMVPHDFAPWGAYSRVFWMPVWLFRTTGMRPAS